MKTKLSDIEAIDFSEGIIRDDDRRRLKWRVEAMRVMFTLNGLSGLNYDLTSNRLIPKTRLNLSRVFVNINLMSYTLRSIKNRITRQDPHFKVPAFGGDLNENNRTAISMFLRYFFAREDIRQLIGDVIYYGLARSMAYVWTFPDFENEWFKIFVDDPMDVYIDPNCQGMHESRPTTDVIIRAIRKNVRELEDSPYYDFGPLAADNRSALSQEKNIFLQSQGDQTNSSAMNGSVIMREMYIMVPRKKGKKDSSDVVESEHEMPENTRETKDSYLEKDDNETGVVQKYCIANSTVGSSVTLSDELKYIPCWRYCAEKEMLYYGVSWCTNIQSPIDQIGRSISNLSDAFTEGNKLTMQIEKLHNVDFGSNENVRKLFVEHGHEPTWLEPMKINTGEFELITMLSNFVQQVGGASLVANGEATPNATSGIAIAQLQAGADNAIVECIANLKTFLENWITYGILEQASYVIITPLKIDEAELPVISEHSPLVELQQQLFEKGAIGKDGLPESPPEKKWLILKSMAKSRVEIEVIPGSMYSDLAAKQDAIELYKLGILPKEELLDLYKIGNTEQIIDKLDATANAEKNLDPDIQMADAENDKMSRGVMLDARLADNHDKHLPTHAGLLANTKDPKVRKNLIEHMKQHVALKAESIGTAGTIFGSSPAEQQQAQSYDKVAQGLKLSSAVGQNGVPLNQGQSAQVPSPQSEQLPIQ